MSEEKEPQPAEDSIWPAYILAFSIAACVVLYSYLTQPAPKTPAGQAAPVAEKSR